MTELASSEVSLFPFQESGNALNHSTEQFTNAVYLAVKRPEPPFATLIMAEKRQVIGSRTRLVMRMVHSRRPLALASPSREFVMTRATLSRSQADPVLFLITKRVREPGYLSNNIQDYNFATLTQLLA